MPKKNKKVRYNFSLRKFDMNSMKKDSTVVFVGKRRSGKSYTLRDMMWHLRDIPFGSVISGTEHASPFFSDFIPSTFIYSQFDPSIPKKILKTQSKLKNKAMAKHLDPTKDKFFFVLDDCLYDSSWAKEEVIRELFMNGRHYNILFIITMQYPLGIPPTLRSNIDYSFIFQDYNKENREKLYRSFAGAFGSKEVFFNVMDNLGEYECLVIDNTKGGRNLEDRVFWYKADMKNNFKMGSEKYWRLHFMAMKNKPDSPDESESESEDEFYSNTSGRRSIDAYQPSSNKIDLRINKIRR